jgi:hypothetical protein
LQPSELQRKVCLITANNSHNICSDNDKSAFWYSLIFPTVHLSCSQEKAVRSPWFFKYLFIWMLWNPWRQGRDILKVSGAQWIDNFFSLWKPFWSLAWLCHSTLTLSYIYSFSFRIEIQCTSWMFKKCDYPVLQGWGNC